jgi:serine/threonine-protein kinase
VTRALEEDDRVSHSGNPTHTEDALDDGWIEAVSEPATSSQPVASQALEDPTTLTGLGPVDASPAELDSAASGLDALADTLLIRSRLAHSPEPPPRAVKDYHPPTFLVPPPGGALPEEPVALRSVWIEPEVTEVKPRSSLSEYAPAVVRARRAAEVARIAARAAASVGQSDAPWSTSAHNEPSAAKRSSLKAPLLAFVASVVVTVGLFVLVLLPKKGHLLVTAAGPGNVQVGSVDVLVDGRRVCSSVPCRVDDVSRGSHLVRVQARGYERTADQAVAVQSGEDSVVHVSLASMNSAGIEVRVDSEKGLRVMLDGNDRGAAPLTLRELSAGMHTLRLSGNPSYAPFEQQLRLEADQLALVEPKLVPLKAVIRLVGGPTALGARVEIIGGGARHDIRNLPASVEVSPDATYQLRATRAGYREYQTEVSFADGVLTKDVAIDMAWDAVAGAKPEVSLVGSLDPPTASAESGSLSANSIPISNVLVDGRPVGTTPVKVPLAAGSHSVVFVHDSLGRKSLNVQVKPGKSAVAAVHF